MMLVDFFLLARLLMYSPASVLEMSAASFGSGDWNLTSTSRLLRTGAMVK
jgi:hypothetical protein